MTRGRDSSGGDPAERADEYPGDANEAPSKADVFIETGFTPKEYVLAVIESNGRRLKQQRICELTGWSDGTVSCILSEMEEAGTITRLRIGRGKVVFLPDAKSELIATPDTDDASR